MSTPIPQPIIRLTQPSLPAHANTPKSNHSTRNVCLRLPSSTLSKFSPGFSGPRLDSSSSWPQSTTNLSHNAPSSQSLLDSNDNGVGPTASTLDAPTSQTESALFAVDPGKHAADDFETSEKPKARPGPRKKPKITESGKIDGRFRDARLAAAAAGIVTHKLGPKASAGAINEKLRALDRTSKECRKWQKRSLVIKSFTCRTWEAPAWHAPQARSFGLGLSHRDTSGSDAGGGDNSSIVAGSDHAPDLEVAGPSGVATPDTSTVAVPIAA